MSVNKYVIAGALFLGLNTVLSAQNADQQAYYRTFSVELKSMDQEMEQSLRALFDNRDFFRLEDVCTDGNKILVAVDASYPKRVNDIISELTTTLSDELGKRKVLAVESIPFSEKNTYCP